MPRRAERPVPRSSRRDSMSTIRSNTPQAKPTGTTTTAAKPAAQAMTGTTQAASHAPADRIAKRAYEKWLKRGCTHGNDIQDWIEAEKEIIAEMKGGAATGARR